MDEEFPTRDKYEARQLCCVVWQLECHTLGKEFGIPFEVHAYWCEVSLDTRYIWEEIVAAWEDSYNKKWVKYDDKVIAKW